MTGTLHLITAPTRKVITLIEAKAQCRVDDNTRDAEIDALIDAVIAKYDGANGCQGAAHVQQTWELRLPCFKTPIEIPLPPYNSLTSVKYLATDGTTETAVASSVYEVVDNGPRKPSLLQPKYGQTWPSVTTAERDDAIRVRFVAGYASVSNAALVATITGGVPRAVQQAMLLEVEQMLDGHTNYADAILALRMPFVVSWF